VNEDVRAAIARSTDHSGPVTGWQAMAALVPAWGHPGVYEAPETFSTRTLVHRDDEGHAIGVLRQWHTNGRPGPLVLVVHPAHRRQGIGSGLVRRALELWGIDPRHVAWTDASRAVADSILRTDQVRLDGPVARPGG
jgi:GNAT superfamily N-acetyltransferase